jgi:hypothetical protein
VSFPNCTVSIVSFCRVIQTSPHAPRKTRKYPAFSQHYTHTCPMITTTFCRNTGARLSRCRSSPIQEPRKMALTEAQSFAQKNVCVHLSKSRLPLFPHVLVTASCTLAAQISAPKESLTHIVSLGSAPKRYDLAMAKMAPQNVRNLANQDNTIFWV